MSYQDFKSRLGAKNSLDRSAKANQQNFELDDLSNFVIGVEVCCAVITGAHAVYFFAGGLPGVWGYLTGGLCVIAEITAIRFLKAFYRTEGWQRRVLIVSHVLLQATVIFNAGLDFAKNMGFWNVLPDFAQEYAPYALPWLLLLLIGSVFGVMITDYRTKIAAQKARARVRREEAEAQFEIDSTEIDLEIRRAELDVKRDLRLQELEQQHIEGQIQIAERQMYLKKIESQVVSAKNEDLVEKVAERDYARGRDERLQVNGLSGKP